MSQTPQPASYRPATEIDALMPDIADPVHAADFPQTLLRFRNDRAAATVGPGDGKDTRRHAQETAATASQMRSTTLST